MKATHTAAAILAAAAILLAPAIASAADGIDAPPVKPDVVAPDTGIAAGGGVFDQEAPPKEVEKEKPKPPAEAVEVPAAVPEAVAPVETAPEPAVPDQTKGTVLYLSQLPACDAGDGTVTSGGVPVNACIWAGQFVALR